jgi:predicted ABC-type sugar transport system permease subunit
MLVPPSIAIQDDAYRRSLNNGNSLDNLLLVQLRTRSVEIADDGGHTGLVTHGGCEVDRLLGVILGEAAIVVSSLSLSNFWWHRFYLPLHLTPVAGGALSRQECQ